MTERFWAKTGKGDKQEDGSHKYHPVICHLADTAAVAMEIVREYLSGSAIATLEKGLGLQGKSLVKCCGFLAGCHDLGKVSPAFQFQVSEVGKALVGQSIYDLWQSYPTTGQKTPHGTVTAATLPEFLTTLGIEKKLAKKLAVIVGGHHGFFPSSSEIQSIRTQSADDMGRGDWFMFRKSIYEQLQGFVELTTEDLPKQCDNAAAMIMAGLTTVSDWIASNADPVSGFPYADNESFDVYAKDLPGRAKKALEKQGWCKPTMRNLLDFRELFPLIKTTRPLQDVAIQLAKTLTLKCFIMVEASMGEGKTEAALYLADWLQHQVGAGGFYIGLPTQATSNAMFQRVREFLKSRYNDQVINLTLSHSAAILKVEYQETVCRLDQIYDQDGKGVYASEWHTARKRTLLSPYGVGTLDQGLMGVVRSRHQFVRLFGLAGRTIILDEIHAYDLYTSTLLERFLEWAAVLGSPVIALSATLPKNTRQKLLSAYASGCEQTVPMLPEVAYPRITTFSNEKVNVQSFSTSEHLCRSLGITWVTEADWIANLQQVLSDEGGCVAIICSTVNRAQILYQRLQQDIPDVEIGLFHGRFLFKDRDRIEQQCLQRFGKNVGHRPHNFILVATQVIEQSLDVDFDLMITDLAPIDLLLQRSGRLHRHIRDVRPMRLLVPNLWIIQPTLTAKGKAHFNESGYIYDRHILLRSWLALRQRSNIDLPEETDILIESVYDLDIPIPDGIEEVHAEDWRVSLEKYRTEEEGRKRVIADEVKIPSPHSNVKPDQFTYLKKEDDESAIAAATRLGEISVATIFLQQTKQALVLPGTEQSVDLKIKPDLAMMRELLAHSTRLSKPTLVSALLAQKNPATWTSALLRNCRYVIVNSQGVAVVGEWKLTLDPLRGVLIDRVESS